MTQAEAATKADLSDTTWFNIETGKPVSARSYRKAGSALGWSGSWFADLTAGRTPVTASPIDQNYTPSFLDEPVEISASGVDLDELAREDPEQYEVIMNLARIALDRARARRRT